MSEGRCAAAAAARIIAREGVHRDACDELLDGNLLPPSVRAFFGETAQRWHDRLRELLENPPNAIAFFRLITLAATLGRSLEIADWCTPKQAAAVHALIERWEIDAAAMRVIATIEEDAQLAPLLRTHAGFGPHLAWDFLPLLLDDALRGRLP